MNHFRVKITKNCEVQIDELYLYEIQNMIINNVLNSTIQKIINISENFGPYNFSYVEKIFYIGSYQDFIGQEVKIYWVECESKEQVKEIIKNYLLKYDCNELRNFLDNKEIL